MTLIAGVDIGNSTTEIVIQEGGRPVAWNRRPTRGEKGSISSIQAAAALLRSIELDNGVTADKVVVAPWRAVTTDLVSVVETPPDTGCFKILDSARHSIAGDAAVAGVPWNVFSDPPDADSIIAVVTSDIGYRQAVQRISQVLDQGIPVRGIVVARDEAVLIASRVGIEIPVLDGVDTQSALKSLKLFLEVRPAGTSLKKASDVWALRAAFEADSAMSEYLYLIARWVRDERATVIGVFDEAHTKRREPDVASITWKSGEAADLFTAVGELRNRAVGAVKFLNIAAPKPTDDLWGVDITDTVSERGIRSPVRSRNVVLASLGKEIAGAQIDPVEVFGKPVEYADAEADAASIGARTTPGLSGSALVLDIGGGTIDLIGQNGITAAGAGEMLTAAVSQVLQVPRGAADWIKRGPAQRVESPSVLLDEDGSRHFVSKSESSISPRAAGALVAPGPGGYMTFGGSLQPAEWRIVRQSLKLEVIANNVARILATYRGRIGSDLAQDVIIVGGPAGDDELLAVLGRVSGVKGFGRGNVAGCLGHRYAVAYGLTQLPRGS